MRLCLICKKRFQETHFHHISYEYDHIIEVCSRCHGKIHKKKVNQILYDLLKPIDSSANIVNITGNREKKNHLAVQCVRDTIIFEKSRIVLKLNIIENKKTGGMVVYIPSIISDLFPPGKITCRITKDKLIIPVKQIKKNTEETENEHSE